MPAVSDVSVDEEIPNTGNNGIFGAAIATILLAVVSVIAVLKGKRMA